MLRFLEAGLCASLRQIVAIILITITAMMLISQDFVIPRTWAIGNAPLGSCDFVSRFLGCAYLLTAIGIVLTCDRPITATADRIRNAARLISPRDGAIVLAVQLVLTSILLALFALRPPPVFLTEIVQYFGMTCATVPIWTGMISIGVAFLGANAYAAIRALGARH